MQAVPTGALKREGQIVVSIIGDVTDERRARVDARSVAHYLRLGPPRAVAVGELGEQVETATKPILSYEDQI